MSDGYDTRAAEGDKQFVPDLALIFAGEFLMGSNPRRDKNANEREQAQHKLHLPDYYLAKTAVTNAHYI